MHTTTIGVDLAKLVFAVNGVDERGNTVLRKTLRREQMVPFFYRFTALHCSYGSVWQRALLGA